MHLSEKVYQLALHLINGIGFQLWNKLIQQFASAQAIFEASEAMLQIELKKLPKAVKQAILNKSTLAIAEKLLQSHQQKNISSLSFFDAAYPERLRHIDKPPNFLFFQGNINLSMPRVVSIVGTRNASDYGRRVVEQLIEGLANYDVLIVSGLAYGIDIHAHTHAFKIGVPTVGVLASGLDIIYPAAHKKIAEAMLQNGGLASEIPIGTPLETFQFPHRNRIIAGLADSSVVIEAPIKSGAMITARFANIYNREVFAVPGNIYEKFSAGCNHLIKTQQAHLLSSAEDIAYIMNWNKKSNTLVTSNDFSEKLGDLHEGELSIVEVLKAHQKEMHIDELSQQLNIPLSNLTALLLQLELKNIVKFLPGNRCNLNKF